MAQPDAQPDRRVHQPFQTPDWEGTDLAAKKAPASSGPFRMPGLGRTRHDQSSSHPKETLATNASISRGRFAPIRRRFDSLLPPSRTYPFGLSRRRFLLFVVAPALLLLLFVLPLALGLGLRNRRGAQNLPLPNDTGGVFTGQLTYYNPGLGACGWQQSDDDPVCAVSHLLWDELQQGSNPNTNTLCGRRIRVQRDVEDVGLRTVDVTVVDRCVGCEATDIDLSPAMFNQLARPELGRVVGRWAWL